MSGLKTRLHNVTDKILPAHIKHIPSPVKPQRTFKTAGTEYVNLTIQFIGASNLPKMDVVGSADPYFVAEIDQKIVFISNVVPDNLAPVWNEIWRVKNVPRYATLKIEVFDKDNNAPVDDYIGGFEMFVAPGAHEAEIKHSMPLRRTRGAFWLKIDLTPSDQTEQLAYVFDGPIRYSRHFSPAIGRLTNINDARLYCTWKMYLRGVQLFLGEEEQHWNREYKAAQSIFKPSAFAVRSTIHSGHRLLYARSTTNSFGVIADVKDVLTVLCSGPTRDDTGRKFAHRVKPAIYTYVIATDDDSFRFSETGAAYFVDYASKHALHSNVAETVRYSGEFHPRPACGWENFDDTMDDLTTSWELMIDNNSGTYAPKKTLLPNLQALLEFNFPNFAIRAHDRDNEELKTSVKACRDYALRKRGVKESELQPHTAEGEETLFTTASLKSHSTGED